ncbi:DNA-directed DNA polymerase eta rad30 [Ceratobasidium sp. 414]|nr:DNA-directed DNA polymerase eta rad30 [Ceratobasidium sp. 414]
MFCKHRSNPLRVIALCDNDAFYASCERVRLNVDPEQPLVVQQWANLAAEAKKKCPNLMAVHVATYKEGESEPRYWDDPSPLTHKVSLDHYRRESSRIFKLFQDTMPAGGEIVFIDYTLPVRSVMLERYPELRLPSGPFDLDTPLPQPPGYIDWASLETNVISASTELSKGETSTSRPSTPTPGANPPSSPLGVDSILAFGSSMSHPDSTLSQPEEPEPESDAPPTWHDIALSIGAEFMRAIRKETCEKLGYTLSAGIARNKMLAKLSASYRKPMAQTVLRNVAIPGYLDPMPFQKVSYSPALWSTSSLISTQKIRFLGGKLGDAMAAQFEATTVAELKEIDLVKERTALKSMAASKNVRPAITTFEQARHWLAVLSAELAVRLTDARKINNTVWPRTLVLHARQASSAPRSKQIPFPFVRAFSAATILASSERLWKTLFLGSNNISPGVFNVSIGFGGLESLETGQKGIEGFLGAKGAASSPTKKLGSASNATSGKQSDSASTKLQRRTASPSVETKRVAPKPKSKHDFFGAAKRKAIEVVDDSDSDIVEISPPPHVKRTNTGLNRQTGGSSRSGTPTPAIGHKGKDKSSTRTDKSKDKGGIAGFFVAAGSSKKAGKK